MQVGMCKWAATSVCRLLRLTNSNRQGCRCCTLICICSCCGRGFTKHLGVSALQVASKRLAVADVGETLAALRITTYVGAKPHSLISYEQ